jgi:hypothetical protein
MRWAGRTPGLWRQAVEMWVDVSYVLDGSYRARTSTTRRGGYKALWKRPRARLYLHLAQACNSDRLTCYAS